MFTRLRLPALLALSCCQVACVSNAAPAPAAAPAAAAEWQLTVSTEGGIAGIARRFTATSTNDTLAVADAKLRSETTVALTRAEKQELAQAVAARAAAPDIDLRSASCRDCILFEMTMSTGSAGKPRRVRYDSASMDASPDAKLIERVIAIGRNGMAQKIP